MGKCEKCGGKHSEEPTVLRLSEAEIEELLDVLHYEVQFYDNSGCRANKAVLDAIRDVLIERFTSEQKG